MLSLKESKGVYYTIFNKLCKDNNVISYIKLSSKLFHLFLNCREDPNQRDWQRDLVVFLDYLVYKEQVTLVLKCNKALKPHFQIGGTVILNFI